VLVLFGFGIWLAILKSCYDYTIFHPIIITIITIIIIIIIIIIILLLLLLLLLLLCYTAVVIAKLNTSGDLVYPSAISSANAGVDSSSSGTEVPYSNIDKA
jgi:hypothetical protein